MIIFNIITNSIKYNKQNGNFKIILNLNVVSAGQNLFETIVQDTSKWPDLEKSIVNQIGNVDALEVERDLQTSKLFADAMKGQIKVDQTAEGETQIKIILPVKIKAVE